MRADDTADRLLDAAEIRLRRQGFHGMSFRDLALDVGIKSASVHYHFPTKTDLGRAVATRYTQRFLDGLGEPADAPGAAVAALVAGFRKAAFDQRMMCLCGLLASEHDGLPEPVQIAVRGFFEATLDWLAPALGDDDAARVKALRIVATLEGALLVAHALGDPALFDAATAGLAEERRAVSA